MQRHVDRLAILVQERNEIAAKLAKGEANGDKAALARTQADLQAIDREISLVSRQPVYPNSSSTLSQTAGAKTASVAQTTNSESQASAGEKVTYEGWDIFKNFGRKGTQP
jgi:hypothetical protein